MIPSKCVSLGDHLLKAVSAAATQRGVAVTRLVHDDNWTFMQEPIETRTVTRKIVGYVERRFYPHLFHWRGADGRRYSLRLDPVVVRNGPNDWREDREALARSLLAAIVETGGPSRSRTDRPPAPTAP